MAAVHGALPARRLAARQPLPRHPPAPNLLRACRVLQVEDTHDVADVALEGRRAVEIAAVEVEAVHAGAAGLPARDLARLRRIAHIIDPESAAPVRRRLAHGLVVHHHQAVCDPRLMRVGARRHRQFGEALRVLRIAHVKDRGAVRAFHMAHIGDAPLDHDLAPPASRRGQPRGYLRRTNSRSPLLTIVLLLRCSAAEA
jgi:hypothetical protein